MRKTSFIMVIIFTVVSLNVFVYRAYGKCKDECIQKCNATIDAKYKWGEGYIKSTIDSTDYLKQKNQEKVNCYGKCTEKCTPNIKKDTVDTDSALKKDPK